MIIVNDQRVILGPPGCGKTTTLLNEVEACFARGIAPEEIAYFSFTRKAVTEAVTRACQRFDFKRSQFTFWRTIHSMTFSELGLSQSDVLGSEHLLEVGRSYGVEFSGKAKIDESTGMIIGGGEGDAHLFMDSLARARCITLREQWQQDDQDMDWYAIDRTVSAVNNYKQAHHLLDFTDMLERYVLRGQPLAGVRVAFIDEAQDLSALQWQVLRVMLSEVETVFIAGDDDQAIYRWSGADVEQFLQLGGHKRVLNQSWRCPPAVHALANNIAGRIGSRYKKDWTAKQGDRGDVQERNDLEALDFSKIEGSVLLLARNSYLLNDYREQLRKQGVAFMSQWGSLSVPAAHARAIYAYEKLRKGGAITGGDVKAIYEQLRVGVGVKRGYKGCTNIADRNNYTAEQLRESFGLLTDTQVPWYDSLDGIALIDRLYYRAILRNGGSLIKPPTVSINTVHGVKGGEADTVIVAPDMAAKTYRSFERAPDDEHRVAYVAVSRARQRLILLAPRGRASYPYGDAV